MERFGSQGTTQFQPLGHLGYVAGDCAVGCVPFAAKVSCLPKAVLGGHEQVQGIYDKLVEMKVKLDILVEPSICMMEEVCHTGSSNDMA